MLTGAGDGLAVVDDGAGGAETLVVGVLDGVANVHVLLHVSAAAGEVQNALALQDALEEVGVDTRVMSAFEIRAVCEPYIRRRAIRHLERGRVVICAAGTGNPYFSTDSAAALRALELEADAILMAKREYDGVYSADPEKEPDAVFIPELTHLQAIERGLKVMDTTALSLCMDNNMPIHVFKMTGDNIVRVLSGERVGTVVRTPAGS